LLQGHVVNRIVGPNETITAGGFQLLDVRTNWIVAGEKFDLTSDEVVAFCRPETLLKN
jgi:hypothetical protein